MTFEKHLFISYAHADNKTTPDDNKGWVSRFHEYLESYLSTNIGEDAAIWRDERLRGNDIFASEIVEQFPHTAVLVSLLSPRYIESEWCIREVNEFCDVAGKHGGLVVDNKARVFGSCLRIGIGYIPHWRQRSVIPFGVRRSVEKKLVTQGRLAAFAENVVFVAQRVR